LSQPAARELLRSLEGASREAKWAGLCFLAGQSVGIDEQELTGAIRRAQLLLAAGGDPRRAPELHGRATTAVAADLDLPHRRAQLRAGLERLQEDVAGLQKTGEALRLLLRDGDLAWQCFAMAQLAAELAEESPPNG
jgi:hypothetical protein